MTTLGPIGSPLVSFPAPAGRRMQEKCSSSQQEMALFALAMASRGGDVVATRRFLAALYPWLKRFYTGKLPPALIDDAVQEAMAAIHRCTGTYDEARPFAAWLTGIAKHKLIDQIRLLQRHATDELSGDVAVCDTEPEMVSHISIETLLALLRPAQASAIRLVKIAGLSIIEAAEATGQSPSQVKVNIHRGLVKLTAMVTRETCAFPAASRCRLPAKAQVCVLAPLVQAG